MTEPFSSPFWKSQKGGIRHGSVSAVHPCGTWSATSRWCPRRRRCKSHMAQNTTGGRLFGIHAIQIFHDILIQSCVVNCGTISLLVLLSSKCNGFPNRCFGEPGFSRAIRHGSFVWSQWVCQTRLKIELLPPTSRRGFENRQSIRWLIDGGLDGIRIRQNFG